MSALPRTVPGPGPLAIGLLCLCAVFLLMCRLAWVGYIGSDDWVYIENARQRLFDPWMVGLNHWQVRLTMTLPMALSFRLFGESELAAALPTLVYAGLTALCCYLFLARRAGVVAAWLAGLLVAASPLLLVNATSLRIDAVENFYVMLSLLVLYLALERPRQQVPLLLAAGLLAGLAFATRPTAVALLLFFGLLFLAGYRMPRARYLWVLAGFLAVWLTESLYFLARTGEFFYRLRVDFNHDQVVRGSGLVEAVVLAPLKLLLTSHSFGLSFWLLPACCWLLLGRGSPAPFLRAEVRYLGLFCLTWIVVFSGFASKLVLDPRYLAPALTAALMVIALAAHGLFQTGRRLAALLLVGLVLAGHGLGLMVENKDFMYAERWLVQLAQRHAEPVYTDPQTRERALFLLDLGARRDQVKAEVAPAGALFLAVPRNAALGRYNTVRWDPAQYMAGDWPVLERLDPGPTVLGRLLQAIGLQRWIPAGIWQKLNQPNPAIVLVRRP